MGVVGVPGADRDAVRVVEAVAAVTGSVLGGLLVSRRRRKRRKCLCEGLRDDERGLIASPGDSLVVGGGAGEGRAKVEVEGLVHLLEGGGGVDNRQEGRGGAPGRADMFRAVERGEVLGEELVDEAVGGLGRLVRHHLLMGGVGEDKGLYRYSIV